VTLLLWPAFTSTATANAQQLNQARRGRYVPGQRAVIIDERLSALRTRPEVKAPIIQRLRRGHVVGILGAAPNTNPRFLRVAVTRYTRGWMMAEALVRAGRAEDAERLMKLIDETTDDFVRARLARLCADEFRHTSTAPRALLALGQAAERAAERLTREAGRRAGDEDPGAGLSKRDYLLNDASLDRYNRAGITFDYDEAADRIIYDGAAYRELLRKHPRSAEAKEAQQRLERLGKL
jgi:hypothetical protein